MRVMIYLFGGEDRQWFRYILKDKWKTLVEYIVMIKTAGKGLDILVIKLGGLTFYPSHLPP